MAASIGNAVYHATGWRPHHLPLQPQEVLTVLLKEDYDSLSFKPMMKRSLLLVNCVQAGSICKNAIAEAFLPVHSLIRRLRA